MYTHAHIPLDPIRAAVATLRHQSSCLGCPVQDYNRALLLLKYGAPIKATYLCSRADLTARNLYGNHAGISDQCPSVLANIVSGSTNHFLFVFP